MNPDPFDEAIEAFERHNAAMAMKRIAIHDPVARETKRQREIIDAALISLASGNTQKTRELLGEL